MVDVVVIVIWTLVAVVGVGVSLWAWLDSVADRRAQRQSGVNSSLAIIVVINLRSAKASLLLHSFFLVLGILAAVGPRARATLMFALFAFGYIAVASTNVRAVGLNQLERVRLRRSTMAR